MGPNERKGRVLQLLFVCMHVCRYTKPALLHLNTVPVPQPSHVRTYSGYVICDLCRGMGIRRQLTDCRDGEKGSNKPANNVLDYTQFENSSSRQVTYLVPLLKYTTYKQGHTYKVTLGYLFARPKGMHTSCLYKEYSCVGKLAFLSNIKNVKISILQIKQIAIEWS